MIPEDTGRTTVRENPLLVWLIHDEIAAVRRERERIRSFPDHRNLHTAILAASLLVNALFVLFRHDYIALFIAASIYLNMFYFISLLVPTSPSGLGTMAPDFPRFLVWLRELGIVSGTWRFTRLFVNALFLNSRAQAGGICLIFVIDIIYAILSYFTMAISFDTILFVIGQSLVIIVFYLLVWKIEPFSTKFVKNIEQVRRSLLREKIPSWAITLLFFLGFLLSVLLFMTAIILFPGITVNTFLTRSGLSALGSLVALLSVLAVSQYFIVRSIHGISSRKLADRLFDYKEGVLEQLLPRPLPATSEPVVPQSPVYITTIFLESKIYQIQRNTFFGFFPVYVIALDFSVMMDSSTRNAIKGYIYEKL
jgi:hypothetical protein